MKKLLSVLIIFTVLAFFLPQIIFAAGIPTPTPKSDVDPKCVAYLLTHTFITHPPCNETCSEICLNEGRSCRYVDGILVTSNDQCIDLEESGVTPIADAINVFGIDIPYDKAVLVLGRAGLMLVFILIGLASIGLGFYAMYLRSSSQGEPEKIEESTKVFKNTIIGLIISFTAVLLIQVVALSVGISDSIFDLTFIPKLGTVVKITPDDLQFGTCRPEQKAVLEGVGNLAVFKCDNKAWTGGGDFAVPNVTVNSSCVAFDIGKIGKDANDNIYLCKDLGSFPLPGFPFGKIWVAAK